MRASNGSMVFVRGRRRRGDAALFMDDELSTFDALVLSCTGALLSVFAEPPVGSAHTAVQHLAVHGRLLYGRRPALATAVVGTVSASDFVVNTVVLVAIARRRACDLG